MRCLSRFSLFIGFILFGLTACLSPVETSQALPTVGATVPQPSTPTPSSTSPPPQPTFTLPPTYTPRPTKTVNSESWTPIDEQPTVASGQLTPGSDPIPTNTPRPTLSTPLPTLDSPTPIPDTPLPTPHVLPQPPVGASAPQIYETTLSIPTYNYEAAFLPTQPEDEVYPYPRLDLALVGGVAPRTYQAVILENGYVKLTILPELGGRLYQWRDKATGRDLLYNNPVIKPTSWGYRGWWLSAGGIEWTFPVEDHGLNEWRPWHYASSTTPYGLAVTVSDIDDRTGMEVGATISLDAGHSYVTIEPWARNNTATAQPYQLWLNGMVSLGGNPITHNTQVIIPAGQVLIHGTADGGVPPSGSTMSWPYHNGRDLSYTQNWTGYYSYFVPNATAGFTGLYDHTTGQGLVRAYTPGWPAGTKLFGPVGIDPGTWTDGSSTYLELWSGATGSFWANATLQPGQTFSWAEKWYPIRNLGGLSNANEQAAITLRDKGDNLAIAFAVTTRTEGKLVLLVDGLEVAEWPLSIVAGQVFETTWPRPAGQATLQFITTNGTTLIQTGTTP